MSALLAAEVVDGGACQSHRAKALEKRALATSGGIFLARSRRALDPPSPHAQVLVGPQSIEVDDTVFFAALTPAQRKQLLAELTPELSRQVPFFRRAVLSAGGTTTPPPDAPAPGPTKVAPLSDLLRLEDEIERRASRLDIGESAVNVRFQWDTPFEVLLGVLATAEQAGLKPLPIVEGLRREGVLQFAPEGMGERGCPAPQLQIGPLGAMVSIEPSAGFVMSTPGTGGKSHGPRWQRVVARDPWQEVVASGDAAADAGFPRPRLRALEPPGGCPEAIPPDARERFSTP